MPTDTGHEDYTDLEARLLNGAPGPRSAASVARVHGAISQRRRMAPVLGMLATATVVVAFAAGALLWLPGQGAETRDASAFAYDRAAEMLAPEDGVLHYVYSYETTSSGEDSAATAPVDEQGNPVAVDEPSGPIRFEVWVDPVTGAQRAESDQGIVEVRDASRWLVDNRLSAPECPRLISEVLVGDTQTPGVSGWVEPGWSKSFSTAIEERSCEVTEDVAPDGTEVWRVTWDTDDSDTMPMKAHYEALFRRSDYRPLSFDSREEWTGVQVSDAMLTHTDVELWEVVPSEDVPEGTFDTTADLTLQGVEYEYINMTPDDTRVADVGFRVWGAGPEAGVGSASSLLFRKGTHVAWLELEQPGMLAIQYGGEDYWDPREEGVSVTTFTTDDRQDVNQYFEQRDVSADVETDSLDGLEYRLVSGEGMSAELMTAIDGQAICITGPNRETVLKVLGSLEPFE